MAPNYDDFDPSLDPHEAAGRPNRVFSSLRGRYVWAALLGLLFAALGGGAGYKAWTPQYDSVGLIRVKPLLERVLYQTEQSSAIPMYDGYISSQMDLMQSERVVVLAMESDEWKQLGRDLNDETMRLFRASLVVTRARGSQVIHISFTDEDPQAPHLAVGATIKAYMNIFGEEDDRLKIDRLNVLEGMQKRLTNEIDSIREDVQRMASAFGSDSLEEAYDHKLQELFLIEEKLTELQLDKVRIVGAVDTETALEMARKGETRGGAATTAREGSAGGALAMALQARMDAETELEQLREVYHDSHRRVKTLQRRLDRFDAMIEQHETPPEDATVGDTISPSVSESELRLLASQETALRQMHEDIKREVLDLGRTDLRIDRLKADLDKKRQQLDATVARIEQLNVESFVRGRISVISSGTTSAMPTNLGKRKQLALLGMMGGLTFGVGLVVLYGLTDRRYRYVSDAQDSIGSLPLLGVLPRLPKNLGDPEQAGIAAHAVQQIRVQLQLAREANERRVLTVTSPVPGDGKTSLTMALGLSFAASGSRTLLIDFDLHGQGLTRHAECIVRPKIGPVLLQEGLVTMDQLAQGLETSTSANCRLGEALVALGVLEGADVNRALALQAEASVGLREVLEGENLEACVQVTETPHLSILPVGGSGPELVGSLSPTSVGRLIGQAQEQFDTVLIDTGPIPASTEACLVASQSNGVLLTVSRGVQQRSAERAVGAIRQVGAEIVGVVFNRAKVSDMAHSGFSSGSSRGSDRVYLPKGPEEHASASRFGPVAHAASLALTHHDEDHKAPTNGRTKDQGAS